MRSSPLTSRTPYPPLTTREAYGRLVGPPVFKTGERSQRSLAGSIPVRLRHPIFFLVLKGIFGVSSPALARSQVRFHHRVSVRCPPKVRLRSAIHFRVESPVKREVTVFRAACCYHYETQIAPLTTSAAVGASQMPARHVRACALVRRSRLGGCRPSGGRFGPAEPGHPTNPGWEAAAYVEPADHRVAQLSADRRTGPPSHRPTPLTGEETRTSEAGVRADHRSLTAATHRGLQTCPEMPAVSRGRRNTFGRVRTLDGGDVWHGSQSRRRR